MMVNVRFWRTAILAVCGVVLAAGAPASAGVYRDAVLADNPVGYWRLNEAAGAATAVTEVNSPTLDGSYLNGPTLEATGPIVSDGAENLAMSVAAGQGVSVADNDLLDLTRPGAIEGWFMVSSALANQGDLDYPMLIKPDGSGSGAYGFYTAIRGGAPEIRFFLDDVPAWGPQVLAHGAAAEYDTWYHLVGTWDETEGNRFYVNGDLVADYYEGDSSLSGPAQVTDQPLYGAGVAESGWALFAGALDELAVYDGAISADRVTAHYNAALVPEPASLGMLFSGVIGLLLTVRASRRREPKTSRFR